MKKDKKSIPSLDDFDVSVISRPYTEAESKALAKAIEKYNLKKNHKRKRAA